MALALRLFLLLLLAVALHARAAQAAPVGVRRADEIAGNAIPGTWMNDGLDQWDLLEASSQYPFPNRRIAVNMARAYSGPPRWKNKDVEDKKSLEAAKHLDKMLTDLEKRREMDQKAVQMMTFPRESNLSQPVPYAEQEVMPSVTTEEVLGKSLTNPQDTATVPRIFCPQDVRKSCMIGTVVTLFTVPLGMVLCYVGFRWWRGKKRRPATAPSSAPGNHESPSPLGRPKTVRFDTSEPQQSPRTAEQQRSIPPPRPPSPTLKRKLSDLPPPPPLPSRPPWASS